MIRIANAQLWVHDQDEALAFYTEKLGFEVRTDATLPELGNFRWLTVSPAGQPDVAIVLMAIPGPPVMDEDVANQVRSLMAAGFAGTVFLTTEDCQASYEELKARGVEFTEAMLHWPAGPRDSDGVWARYWYDAVVASTGFEPYRAREVSLDGHPARVADEALTFYELLHAARVQL